MKNKSRAIFKKITSKSKKSTSTVSEKNHVVLIVYMYATRVLLAQVCYSTIWRCSNHTWPLPFLYILCLLSKKSYNLVLACKVGKPGWCDSMYDWNEIFALTFLSRWNGCSCRRQPTLRVLLYLHLLSYHACMTAVSLGDAVLSLYLMATNILRLGCYFFPLSQKKNYMCVNYLENINI